MTSFPARAAVATVAAVAAALAVGTVAGARDATPAADGLPPSDVLVPLPADPRQDLAADDGHYARNAAAVATRLGPSARTTVEGVLAQANHEVRADCPAAAEALVPPERTAQFCFGSGDTNSTAWVPQGVTGSGDATPDGLWAGRDVLVTSWYHDTKGVRVTLVDRAAGRYVHVLLVVPATGGDTYRPLLLHAGGIAWYGTRLYVADTSRGLRVFDLAGLLDLGAAPAGTTARPDLVGRHGSTWYGYGYRFVLPQTGAWFQAAKPPKAGACTPGGPMRYSSVSVDRTSTPDSLVTAEYCDPPGRPALERTPDTYGRVARWALDEASGAPAGNPVAPVETYRMPVPHVQGAAVIDGTWAFSHSRGRQRSALLVQARPGEGPTFRPAAAGTEDLYLQPQGNRLWTLTEWDGARVVYAVTP